MLKSIKLVLFDFDGTLSDSHQAAMEVYESISKDFGYRSLSSDDMLEIRNMGSRELLRHLGIPMIKLPWILKEARQRFQKKVTSLKPFNEVQSALVELKKSGVELGILTSNGRESVETFLKSHQMDVFDFVHSGASIFGKARLIRKLLKKKNLKPQEAVYVGDETRDIEAAKAAGIWMISVGWGFNSKPSLQNLEPDYLIERPSELPRLFDWHA